MAANNYIQFDFETNGTAQTELLLALLTNQGFEGFEENENYLSAFIKENDFDETAFSNLSSLFPDFSYSKTVIENINWNKEWESSFEPVVINHFAAIRAAFHQPIAGVKHDIIITPKMSFGTGHHATTYLMIEQMSKLDFQQRKVLDFGSGTGVLAILAEKMGAASIFAIDNDEWSIENLKENITANNCNKITIQQSDILPEIEIFDVILANINLNVILQNLSSIAAVSKTGTKILLSGFLDSDELILSEALIKNNFIVTGIFKRGEWISVLAQGN